MQVESLMAITPSAWALGNFHIGRNDSVVHDQWLVLDAANTCVCRCRTDIDARAVAAALNVAFSTRSRRIAEYRTLFHKTIYLRGGISGLARVVAFMSELDAMWQTLTEDEQRELTTAS